MFGHRFIQLTGLLCLAVLPGVFAVPKVTPVPLSGNCSDYSTVEYRRDRNKSGAFVLKLVTETNSTVTNIYSSARTSYRYDFVLFFGFIDFAPAPYSDRTYFRCSNDTLQAYVPTDFPEKGWKNIVVSEASPSRPLAYAFSGVKPTAFAHYLDGVKQDGIFIGGYQNSTTWAFSRVTANDSRPIGEQYSARLLTPNNTALQPGEFTAFIKAEYPFTDIQ